MSVKTVPGIASFVITQHRSELIYGARINKHLFFLDGQKAYV